MRHNQLKLCAVLLLGLGLSAAQAQESTNATGGEATGSGGSASYSIGQMVYTTNTGTDGSVAQGVQQAFEVSVLGVNEVEGLTILLAAYPNPTATYLTLEVKDFDLSNLSLQMFDIHGRLLRAENITSSQTQLDMGNLPVATYFVKVSHGTKEVKTFKIVKN
ncbi:T9SS type A sorting domain-containing protein [Aequorivita sp. F47161]|uniref:T9SS type A sorting domain-containing protein n=1 Tax=Aequorivita vitellina TaxID=2874475 RepID=A0A9X1U2B5_9FLAO|nr:T9SS type A sorting domain-containing protein [Aequorivita vitellina]MCG2420484.1 T9SS type A sorting domain-containing protein [Aequorivita vitellina]